MKERPILFSGPMVRAILEGCKTQTRRVVKPQPVGGDCIIENPLKLGWMMGQLRDSENAWRELRCPYGIARDRLWVRETFVLENTYEYHGDHDAPNDGRPIQKHQDGDGGFWLIPHYRATEPEPNIVPYDKLGGDDDRTRWTPAIYMPRWASRITLEITSVRVERLQDISEEDAKADGCERGLFEVEKCNGWTPFRLGFCLLWDNINGPGSWDLNPWVWCVSFRRID